MGKMKFDLRFIIGISFFLFLSACQKNQDATVNNEANNTIISVAIPQVSKSVTPNILQQTPINVAKLAGKSVAEIDKIFGEAIEIKEITIPKKGEYRVYEIADEPKGLAVRFYDGRAKNFNLILSEPAATARAALKQSFAIDVGSQTPIKDAKEPLSEKWSGEFGGVKFSTVYAKRESANGGFVFVLAETAN